VTVVFLTGTPSPFQVELGEAIRAAGHVDYHVAFASPSLGDRGLHWRLSSDRAWVHRNDSEAVPVWAREALGRIKPTVVLCGGIRGPLYAAARDYSVKAGAALGIYAEQPSPKPWPADLLRDSMIGSRFRRDVDFVLAIGDRAFETYLRWMRRPQDVYQVGYYQDLAPAAYPERMFDADRTAFLFSGRLLSRNRPLVLLRAFGQLQDRYGESVSLCISARGPLEAAVNEYLRGNPGMAAQVRMDVDFSDWCDRLRPFRSSDVLVVPARHSGWGLVVPEALRCGLAVVATRGVESARQLLRQRENGLFCSGTQESLFEAMSFLVANPSERIRMQRAAVDSPEAYGVGTGARIISTVLRRYLGGSSAGRKRPGSS
jgi:glycosyltransferase involved in cell wall biosynthesis